MPIQQIPNTSAATVNRSLYRPELDVLRFIAFFGVFLFHTAVYPVDYYVQHHVPEFLARLLNAVMSGGSYGVNLFFALSSYLITDLLLREREQYGSLDIRFFYLRRILRIWPLYYFLILITLLVPMFDPTRSFGLRYVLPFLFLSGNWALVAFGGLTSVAASPLWSVSVEEQFYLLWPPVVQKLSRRQIIYAAIGMIVVANLTRLLLVLSAARPMALWANTLAQLDSIASGILLAVVLRGQTPSITPTTRAVLALCGFFGISLRAYFETQTGDRLSWGTTLLGWPVVVASCALILFAFIGMKVEQPWLQYLGKISYGLYGYHMFCIMTVEHLMGLQRRVPEHTLTHAAVREIFSLGLTIAVAALSYAILEKPFLRLKQRFTRVTSRPA